MCSGVLSELEGRGVCCVRDYCNYGCCHCVVKSFYAVERQTTSVCFRRLQSGHGDGESARAAANAGGCHHYRRVDLAGG